jgi:hypothetical protein
MQAPHCAMPQPYFVPVSPISSRSTHSNGICGSTSTWCFWPLTLRETDIARSCKKKGQRRETGAQYARASDPSPEACGAIPGRAGFFRFHHLRLPTVFQGRAPKRCRHEAGRDPGHR